MRDGREQAFVAENSTDADRVLESLMQTIS